jgi:general secretion pathway protein E
MELQARKRTPNIRQDGVRRVLSGETSVEEVLRVSKEDAKEA